MTVSVGIKLFSIPVAQKMSHHYHIYTFTWDFAKRLAIFLMKVTYQLRVAKECVSI